MRIAAHRAYALLVVALGAFAASACGGKILPGSEPAPVAPDAGDDANGVGPMGDDTSSSSGAGSSGGNVGSSGGSSSGSPAGSSGTGGSSGDAGVTCTSSRQCSARQVCCGTIMMTTGCQAGPCPSTPIGPIQLCSSTAECAVRGDTCGPLAVAPQLPIMVCNAPAQGGGCSATCTGCCDASGICMMGGDDTACGARGAVCTDCTTAGKVCGGGACMTTVAE